MGLNEKFFKSASAPTGSDYFTPVLYTGDSNAKSITSLNFQPDLVWIKNRDADNWHILTDSLRGVTKTIFSNDTSPETTAPGFGSLSSFDSNGFTVSPGSFSMANVGADGEDYVAWCWKAGGADVLNEDGTIDSQVSANVDAGFSIVKYTGNATSGATVGHGLSSRPDMYIVKNLSVTGAWYVYHTDVTTGKVLILNLTDAGNSSSFTNGTEPTSSVFSLGSAAPFNGSLNNFIAYCFHSVEGYSKIGSYTGNGSANGPTIVTGFRPAFVMIKLTDSTGGNWQMMDNKRGEDKQLYANLSNAEGANNYDGLDFLSNGFQLKTSYIEFNGNGKNYIFMAFAEEAFNPNGVTRNDTNPFGDASELALYKFEDDATDAEGSYNGTWSGTETYGTGYIDKAAVFNGSSYINNTSITAFPSGTSERTLSFWVNAQGSGIRVIGGYGSAAAAGFFGLSISSSNIINFLGQSYNVATTYTIPQNQWVNIVTTYDGTTQLLYANGIQVYSISRTYNTVSSELRIGDDLWGTTERFNGSIDQVRIFDRALDSGEILQLYNE